MADVVSTLESHLFPTLLKITAFAVPSQGRPDCTHSLHLGVHNQLLLWLQLYPSLLLLVPLQPHSAKNLKAKNQAPRDPTGSLTAQQSPCKEAISYMLGLFPKLIALIYLTRIHGLGTRHLDKASVELLQQHCFTRVMWLM